MSRLPRPARSVAGVLVAVTLVVAGCSVSTNDEPQAAGNLFNDLLVSSTTTTSSTTPEDVTKSATLYFLEVDEGATRLVPVERDLDIDAEVQEVLANLFTVPPNTAGDERESEEGLTSAIGSTASLRSATLAPNSSQLIVDITGLFGSTQGTGLRNALAQIVWTATADPNVNEVSFRNGGVPVDAIVGNGTSVARAVNRNDYTSLT